VARTRLAVALVVPEPHRTEIDGLRRALGGDLERIAPHITVVPPINVRDEAMDEAVAILRGAAAELAGPLELGVGPGDTFMPVNRVVYLAVDGVEKQLGALDSLRAGALSGVLARDEDRPFVPRVTLSNRVDTEHIPAALRSTAGYRVEVAFDAVDLLAFDTDARRWSTIADIPLGARRIVGRGGIELEVTTSRLADPAARSFVGRLAPGESDLVDAPGTPLVVVARREGEVVGVAWGRSGGSLAWFDGLVVDPEHRRSGIGSHVLAAFGDDVAQRGATSIVSTRRFDGGVRELLEARGWSEPDPGSVLVAAGSRRTRRRWRSGSAG
jgi:2'-5' RNA ligase/GNAT superfamily N-acetyltransferase